MRNLEWKIIDDGRPVCAVAFYGSITEASDFSSVLAAAEGQRAVHLDLEGIERVNSSGVREWLRFMRSLCDGRQVRLERCSVAIVQQLNMVSEMAGNAEVLSFMLPYQCETCDRTQTVLADPGCSPTITVAPRECPSCGSTMEFDDLPEVYLGFLDS